MDTEFAQEFNKSAEPYKTAYEYLKQKSQTKVTADEAYKDKIIKTYLEENGIAPKEKKDVPPNLNGGGKSNSSPSKVASDGFASVFG